MSFIFLDIDLSRYYLVLVLRPSMAINHYDLEETHIVMNELSFNSSNLKVAFSCSCLPDFNQQSVGDQFCYIKTRNFGNTSFFKTHLYIGVSELLTNFLSKFLTIIYILEAVFFYVCFNFSFVLNEI